MIHPPGTGAERATSDGSVAVPTAPVPTRVASGWVWTTTAATLASIAGVALLAPEQGRRPDAGLLVLVFLGPAMHVGSTGWLASLGAVRACARRHPMRLCAVPVLLILGCPLAVTHLPRELLGIVLEGFFAWQFFHFAKQNVGVATLASTSHGGGSLRPTERRCIVVAGCCGIGALLAHPSLLGLPTPLAVPPLFGCSAVGLFVTVLVGLGAFARRSREARPVAVTVAYTVALCFSAPLFVVSSPYGAVGGMTIAHGFQYLVLLGLVAAGRRSTPHRGARLAGLALVALLGGMALQATSVTSFDAGGGRLLLGCYLGIVTAHMVVDAGLWRLRDPSARAFVAGALPDLVAPAPRVAPGRMLVTSSVADIES